MGVHKGCLLSPILFHLLLEKIMQETFHDHHISISTGGRPIATYNLPTTSILQAAAMVNFKHLTNRLVDTAAAYGMEVSTEKSKIMTNSTNNVSADIRMNGQKLEEVTRYKM